MCDNCDNLGNEIESMDLDDHQIAGIALTSIGVLVESYCEQGYADPMMYRSLELACMLARKFGNEELTTHLESVKIHAGLTIDNLIEQHNLTEEEN
jgi:hypothetical protein